jgi:hypothetical protein
MSEQKLEPSTDGIVGQTIAAHAAVQALPFPQAVQAGMRDSLNNGAPLPQVLKTHLPLVPTPTLDNFNAAARDLGEQRAVHIFSPGAISKPLPIGTAVFLAPGQEHHLPHEAWHVVQQQQGRVTKTLIS